VLSQHVTVFQFRYGSLYKALVTVRHGHRDTYVAPLFSKCKTVYLSWVETSL